MTERICITYLTPLALNGLAGRIMDVIKKENINDLSIVHSMEMVEKDMDELNNSLKRQKANAFTKPMQKQIKECKRAFISLRDLGQAGLSRKDSAISEAANRITAIIKTRGWTLYNRGYLEQSAAINQLLDDLGTEQAKEDVRTIGGQECLADLIECQTGFESVYNSKLEAESRQEALPVNEPKKSLFKHLCHLVDVVRLLAERIPTQYETIINRIDEAIKDTMSVARGQKTRDENAVLKDVQSGEAV